MPFTLKCFLKNLPGKDIVSPSQCKIHWKTTLLTTVIITFHKTWLVSKVLKRDCTVCMTNIAQLTNFYAFFVQKIWRRYKECCLTESAAALGLRPVAYRTFCRYWLELLPHIVISKPRSDLCWTCQQNSTAIMKLTNRSDREKERVFYYTVTSINLTLDLRRTLLLQ